MSFVFGELIYYYITISVTVKGRAEINAFSVFAVSADFFRDLLHG